MEKYIENPIHKKSYKENYRKEVLMQYFPELPFVHFTTLKVKYNNESEKDTGAESQFQEIGVMRKTSAVSLDIDNFNKSLEDAFDFFYHHAERMNRSSIRRLDGKKPRQSLPGMVIIRNNNQVLEDVAPIDNPGHVFLDETGPESVMSVIKLDKEFSPLETAYTDFNELAQSSFQNKQERQERIKNNIKNKYSDALVEDILKRIKENKYNYSQSRINDDIDKLVASGLLTDERSRHFKESLIKVSK